MVRRSFIAVALAALIALPVPATAQSREVVVFAAASLKNALDEVNAQWQRETGKKATVSYAASSALARQIDQGAPADLFISADLDWMDYLQQRNLIRSETRANLLGNRIVLIAPKDSTVSLRVGPGFNLSRGLAGGRLVLADVNAVPAGKYGKAALEALGVWPSVQNQIAQTENVRAALLLVSRGEAPLGIVYQTDAAADPNVKIVDAFPDNTYPPVIYPLAMTTSSRHADASTLASYFQSARTKPLFEKHGFTVIEVRRPGAS